ncbi:MAG: amino acid decarboxylase [Eubacterium sp.]|nr:amino acid decarboxylase [Eubacterium sp.]
MDTPICDFVRQYEKKRGARLHMPGHKGITVTGPEAFDITEIAGADELYSAKGIIRESEDNAAALFGSARTFYSAAGSSLCIRAMLYLALLSGREKGLAPKVLAARNVHKSFISAAVLLDLDVDWLYGEEKSLLSCRLSPGEVQEALAGQQYAAVYITSPDYLGNLADIAGIAKVCHAAGVPLLVDNAHGAYLKFTDEEAVCRAFPGCGAPDLHPLTLGADMCCDSAHKTLPALTGAAYLHIGNDAPALWEKEAENALALFGSTSPSYLILQSLDAVNALLADGYPDKINKTVRKTALFKERFAEKGWVFAGNEPMKITLEAKKAGYTGLQLADALRKYGVECEFADPDFCVLMPSAETADEDWALLEKAFGELPVKDPLPDERPGIPPVRRRMRIRDAVFAPHEELPAEECAGRIFADAYMGCPPAVPVAIAGELLDEEAVKAFRYYGIEKIKTVI